MNHSAVAFLTGFVALACVSSAAAQPAAVFADPVPGDIEARFAAMNAELSSLQFQLQQMQPAETVTIVTESDQRPVHGWYGGFELVVVRPHFQSRADFAAARAQQFPPNNDGGNTDAADSGDVVMDTGDISDIGDIDSGNIDAADGNSDNVILERSAPVPLQPEYSFQATPRIFLGCRNENGLGIRGRYWIFDGDSDPLLTEIGSEQDQQITQSLNLQAADFELTQLVGLGWCELEFGGGVRYGHVKTTSTLDPRFGNNPNFVNDIPTQFRTNFDGLGPTTSLSVRRPLGDDTWRWWAISAVRCSSARTTISTKRC